MTTAPLDIVDLIEKNPITRLTNTYQNNLLTKIKSNFTDDEQHMFVASFYCYLNYNQRMDYAIDLDNVWKWIGFSTKGHAKYLLEKNFVADKDYKCLVTNVRNQKIHARGGHNKETIMLTVRTFKLFCVKAGTKKAEQIHEYYIKLEETLQEVISEESNDLRLLLEQKTTEIQNQVIKSTKEKELLREKTLLEQFQNNTQCVYYGLVDNRSNNGEPLIKFGNSNNLKNRVKQHKDTYLNFRLVNAFRVDNKLQIENAIKEYIGFKDRLRTIAIDNKKYIELMNITDITFTELDKTFKDIISSIEYSPENYIRILEENRALKKMLDENVVIKDKNLCMLLTEENKQLKIDNLQLIKKYNTLKTKFIPAKISINDYAVDKHDIMDTLPVIELENIVVSTKDIEDYGIIRNTDFAGKRTDKSKDGKYQINGKDYDKLFGTRQDVWDGTAYKTSGELIKEQLIINKNGKLVSKKKSITETTCNRFEQAGINIPRQSVN